MANFCNKCGSRLDPVTGACPNCAPAAEPVAAPVVEPVVSAAEQVAAPVAEQVAAPVAEPFASVAESVAAPVAAEAQQYAPPQQTYQQQPARANAAPAQKGKSRVGRTIIAVLLFVIFVFTSLLFVVFSVSRNVFSKSMGSAIVSQIASIGSEAISSGDKDIADDLNDKFGYDVNDDMLKKVVASDSMKKLIGKKFEDLGSVVFDGKNKDISVTRDEIADIIIDNKDILEDAIDHKITKEDALNIAGEVTKGKESIEIMDSSDLMDDEDVLEIVGFFLSKANIIILGVVSLILIALIILCRPGLGYIGCAAVTLLWSAPLFVGGIIAVASPTAFADMVDISAKDGNMAVVAVITGILRANLILTGALCVGAIALIVGGIIVSKKLKNRS